MTEKELRTKVANTIGAWIGAKQGGPIHKEIIDTYNSHKPLARGYKMGYADAWCAATVSAVAIELGLTDIMPTECGCESMINLYKKLGRWEENDAYTPQVGDVIFYDWADNGVGDCKGTSDHVGICVQVKGGTIEVVEGNKSTTKAVGTRVLGVNARYIRGYGLPDYASKADKAPVKDIVNIKAELIPSVPTAWPYTKMGSQGIRVEDLQKCLNFLGYKGKDGRILTVDGIAGTNTIYALRSFQRAKGLYVDGIYGPQTKEKMAAALS